MKKSDISYGWIAPKPNKRERFIRWILRQPLIKHDYTITFPVVQTLPPGTRIRMTKTNGSIKQKGKTNE